MLRLRCDEVFAACPLATGTMIMIVRLWARLSNVLMISWEFAD
jgi:hypothetical protein